MKIATFNVNGINGRLPVLLRWLNEAQPDIVCLQELKAPQEKFPKEIIREAGFGAIWHGEKSWNGVAILARGQTLVETRRALPGEAEDTHSRYIEAAVNGIIVGCLYLPNGNPAPGPKFDYKLRWFSRFIDHAAGLLSSGLPVILAGDYNVMPTTLDVYKPERWVDDALFRPEVRAAFQQMLAQGWTDAVRSLHPGETIYTFWDYFRNAYGRNAGLRLDHLLLSPALKHRLLRSGVDRDVRGWDKASDHAPTWIELADAASRGSDLEKRRSAPPPPAQGAKAPGTKLRKAHAMKVDTSSSRTTGNDAIEGVDPGGTHSTKPGNPDKSSASPKGKKIEETVESGDRNTNPDVDSKT